MLPLTRTQKRRSRQRFFGTVIKSCANQKWTVYWDEIDRCADHAYNNLRYESNSGMTLVGVNVDAILATKHLGSADNKVIDRFLATWHPPATPLPLAQNVQVLPQTQPSVVETVEEQSTESMETPTTIDLQPVTMHQPSPVTNSTSSNSTNLSNILTPQNPNLTPNQNPQANPPPNLQTNGNNTQQESDETNNEPEQEEVFDPDSIVCDIVDDDQNGRNLTLLERYTQEKRNLIGTQVTTAAGLTWTIRDDILETEVEDDYDSVMGVKNFDFNKKKVKSNNRGQTRINFLDLLIHLWPGDWREQLTQLNHRISENYKEKVRATRHGRVKKVQEITEREFWVFWGIIVAARLDGRKGGRLWDRMEPEGYGAKVDLSRYMKEHRFVDIKRFVPFLFAD